MEDPLVTLATAYNTTSIPSGGINMNLEQSGKLDSIHWRSCSLTRQRTRLNPGLTERRLDRFLKVQFLRAGSYELLFIRFTWILVEMLDAVILLRDTVSLLPFLHSGD